jgi:hypothetical protein
VKQVVCQFHLVTQKFDVGDLKKDDRGAILSQVKNWITSWVNHCENEGEYLKSFGLFTTFMERPDVMQITWRVLQLHNGYIHNNNLDGKEREVTSV